MNKNEITSKLATQANITNAQALKVYNTILDIISTALVDGEKIMLSNFGILQPMTRKGRQILHPISRETIEVADKKTIKFKPSNQLLEKMNNKS